MNKKDKWSKKLLNISFLITLFLSFSWFFYCLRSVGLNFVSAQQVYQNVMMISLPILIMWVIFAIIKNYSQNMINNRRFNFFLEQTQKNTNAINSMNEAIWAYAKEMRGNVALEQAEILIADINEILAEIIKRSNSVSSLQMEHLMGRTLAGERWLVAKTLIEINNFQADFVNHLLDKSNKDSLLKGSILEFSVRYKSLYELLGKYDKFKVLYNSVEYGALGKVFNILAPVVEKVSNSSVEKKDEKIDLAIKNGVSENIKVDAIKEEQEFPSFLTSSSYTKKDVKKENVMPVIDIDEGLKAIKEELISEKNTKTFSAIPNFSNTQSALRSLKQETSKQKIISLDELEKEINASPDNNFDEKKTPFGDWLNEANK